MQEFTPFRLLNRKATENKRPGCEAESLMRGIAAASNQLDHVRPTKIPSGDDQLRVAAFQNCPRAFESGGAFRSRRGPHTSTPARSPAQRRTIVRIFALERGGKQRKRGVQKPEFSREQQRASFSGQPFPWFS
jgi:hypothetical protein